MASGIDSAVLGEGEILGQVRDAWEAAQREGAAGPILGRLFRHAVEVGKRARSETAIARGTTSLSQAAVAMAAERLGTLEAGPSWCSAPATWARGWPRPWPRCRASASWSSTGRGPRPRPWPSASAASRSTFGGLPAALEQADVLLTSTGAPGILLEAADLEPVLPARQGRPLLVVDVAVPRDVDPAWAACPA